MVRRFSIERRRDQYLELEQYTVADAVEADDRHLGRTIAQLDRVASVGSNVGDRQLEVKNVLAERVFALGRSRWNVQREELQNLGDI